MCVCVCVCVRWWEGLGGGPWRRMGQRGRDGTGLSSGKHITFHHNRARQETTGSHIALLSHRVLSDTLSHSSVIHTHAHTPQRGSQHRQHTPGWHCADRLQGDLIRWVSVSESRKSLWLWAKSLRMYFLTHMGSFRTDTTVCLSFYVSAEVVIFALFPASCPIKQIKGWCQKMIRSLTRFSRYIYIFCHWWSFKKLCNPDDFVM